MGSVEAFVDAILQWAPCPPISPCQHSRHLEALVPLDVQDHLVTLLESYADIWPPAFLVGKALKSLISYLEHSQLARTPATVASVEGAAEDSDECILQPVSDRLYELWCRMEASSTHAGGQITFPLRLEAAVPMVTGSVEKELDFRVSAWKAVRFSDVATNIWPALFVLVEFMLLLPLTYEDLHGLYSGRTALELGAGTGIAGIMLQRALNRLPGPRGAAAFGHVELTDGEAVSVDLISRNIAENAAVDAAADTLHASQLRWALDGDCERHARPNMIVFGSDLIYDPIDIPPLVCTVHAHLTPLSSPLPSPPLSSPLSSPSMPSASSTCAHPGDKVATALAVLRALHACGGSFAILANTYREPSSFDLYEKTLTDTGLQYVDATELFTHMAAARGSPIIITYATVWDALLPPDISMSDNNKRSRGGAAGASSKRDADIRVHVIWRPPTADA